MCFGFLITPPHCLLWYISQVPSLNTVDSCAKLQSNVSKKTSADNTSVAWCYVTWWNAESFLNILWRGNGVTRCILSNNIRDVTLLRWQSSNPPSTKKGEWRDLQDFSTGLPDATGCALPAVWLVWCLVALRSWDCRKKEIAPVQPCFQ